MAIAVDLVGELVGAVVEIFRKSAADQRACALEELRQGVRNDVGAVAGHDLGNTRDPEPDRRHERRHVTFALGGEARIAVEYRKRAFIDDARVDHLGRWHDDTLLVNRSGVGANRAGVQAADVGEMRPAHHEGAEATAVEHRRQQHLVVRISHGTLGAIAVIVPIEIARLHCLAREVLEDRGSQIAEDRHHRTHRHHAALIEERGIKVLLFTDEGRDGCPFDEGFHLALGRHDRPANDLQCHWDRRSERHQAVAPMPRTVAGSCVAYRLKRGG